MNVSSLSNYSGSCNNQSAVIQPPNFKGVYKISVNRALVKGSEAEVLGEVKTFISGVCSVVKDMKFCALGNKQFGSGRIGTFFKKCFAAGKIEHEYSNMHLDFESLKFNTVKTLQKDSGYADFWLLRHLGIEQPKPISDTHHTFFLYTGNDCLKRNRTLSRANLQKCAETNLKTIKEKVATGEMRDNDMDYWSKIMLSEDADKKMNTLRNGVKVESIVIDSQNDAEQLYSKLDEAVEI